MLTLRALWGIPAARGDTLYIIVCCRQSDTDQYTLHLFRLPAIGTRCLTQEAGAHLYLQLEVILFRKDGSMVSNRGSLTSPRFSLSSSLSGLPRYVATAWGKVWVS